MADWHTKLKPAVEKELEIAARRLEQPGLSVEKTEFLRGEIYALRMVLDTAKEKPKPE
jgi:hypothetical protein